MKRKILSLILAFAMTVSLFSVGAGAAEPTYGDTAGHWAESAIDRWSGHGIIQGSNGEFDPNGPLTCAQLATILAKLLKLPAATDAGFNDNAAGAWYYDAINRCAAAGILNGNGDGTVDPNGAISRERAMVMLGRALGIKPLENPDLTKFSDAAKVASYAQGMVAALIEKGIVGGVTSDTLAPQDDINRASTVTILDRAIRAYADKTGGVIKVEGTGIVIVVADDVTITGDVEHVIIPADNVDVTIRGCENIDSITVTGENSKVILDNSSANDVTLDSKNTEIETKGNSKVDSVNVSEDAAGATVNAGSGTSIGSVENKAEDTTVTGNGSVKEVASDKDMTVETKNTEVKNTGDEKISVTDKNGKTTETTAGGSSTTTGGSSGSSSGGSSHSHSYIDATHRCSCGQFDPAVVATIGNEKGYLTLAEAVAAARDGDTVKLVKDVTLDQRVTANFSGTIDLNGRTLTSTATCDNGSVFHVASGTLTIKNGSMIGVAGPTGWTDELYQMECDAITVASGATVTLEDLSISICSRTGACVYAYDGGKAYVTSGTYSNDTTEFDANGETKAMLLNQADSKPQAIFVSGGTFKGENPAHGDNSGTPNTFLAAGYVATETSDGSGIWTVTEAPNKTFVAQVGNGKYETLAAAIAAAQNGDTVTLLDNVTVDSTISVDKNLKLDLGGKTLTGTSCRALHITGGKLELTGSGIVTSTGINVDSSVIRVGDNTGDSRTAELVIGKDVVIEAPASYGVSAFGTATTETLTIYGTVKSTAAANADYDGCAVATLGTDTATPATITIKEGAVISAEHTNAVYLPAGMLTVEGGTITGTTGIYFKSTNMTISGGTITGNGEAHDYEYYGNGGISTGEAVTIDSCNYPGGVGSVVISGGTFTSENAAAVGSYNSMGGTEQTAFITGGMFSDLASAVKYAANGATIELAKDMTIQNPIEVNKNLTIDGGNSKITIAEGASFINVTGAPEFTLQNICIDGNNVNKVYGVHAKTSGGKLSFKNVNTENCFKSLFFDQCQDTEIELEDCVLTSTYPFNVNGKEKIKSLKAKGCTFNGWTSFDAAKDNAVYTFEDCTFGKGAGYATLKMYGDTNLTRCTFTKDYFAELEGGIASGTKTPITINFNNCQVNDDGTLSSLSAETLNRMFNYGITSGSSSGDSTINSQKWLIDGQEIELTSTET